MPTIFFTSPLQGWLGVHYSVIQLSFSFCPALLLPPCFPGIVPGTPQLILSEAAPQKSCLEIEDVSGVSLLLDQPSHPHPPQPGTLLTQKAEQQLPL